MDFIFNQAQSRLEGATRVGSILSARVSVDLLAALIADAVAALLLRVAKKLIG